MKSQTITSGGQTYTITYPVTNTDLGNPTIPDTRIIGKRNGVGDEWLYAQQDGGNEVFNVVTEMGYYYNTIEIIGREGDVIVFYAKPTFEFIFTGTSTEVLQGFPPMISEQGNIAHNYSIDNATGGGFKINLHGPSENTTNFTVIVEKPVFSRVYLPQYQYNLALNVTQSMIDNNVELPMNITDAGLVDQDKTIRLANGTWGVTAAVEVDGVYFSQSTGTFTVSGETYTFTSGPTSPTSDLFGMYFGLNSSNQNGLKVKLTMANLVGEYNYVGSVYVTKTA